MKKHQLLAIMTALLGVTGGAATEQEAQPDSLPMPRVGKVERSDYDYVPRLFEVRRPSDETALRLVCQDATRVRIWTERIPLDIDRMTRYRNFHGEVVYMARLIEREVGHGHLPYLLYTGRGYSEPPSAAPVTEINAPAQEETVELPLTALGGGAAPEPGMYAITVEVKAQDATRRAFEALEVEPEYADTLRTFYVLVTDLDVQAPMRHVLWVRRHSTGEAAQGYVDVLGVGRIPLQDGLATLPPGLPEGTTLRVVSGRDSYLLHMHRYLHPLPIIGKSTLTDYTQRPEFLRTDRTVCRPGQTIHVAGLADAEGLEITLDDPAHPEQAPQTVTSGTGGTYATTFTLSADEPMDAIRATWTDATGSLHEVCQPLRRAQDSVDSRDSQEWSAPPEKDLATIQDGKLVIHLPEAVQKADGPLWVGIKTPHRVRIVCFEKGAPAEVALLPEESGELYVSLRWWQRGHEYSRGMALQNRPSGLNVALSADSTQLQMLCADADGNPMSVPVLVSIVPTQALRTDTESRIGNKRQPWPHPDLFPEPEIPMGRLGYDGFSSIPTTPAAMAARVPGLVRYCEHEDTREADAHDPYCILNGGIGDYFTVRAVDASPATFLFRWEFPQDDGSFTVPAPTAPGRYTIRLYAETPATSYTQTVELLIPDSGTPTLRSSNEVQDKWLNLDDI